MNTPTYEQQWQKITEAYTNNKLEPYVSCACFIGNLLNNTDDWSMGRICTDYQSPFLVIRQASRDSEYCDVDGAIKSIMEQSEGMYTLSQIIEMEQTFLRAIAGDEHNEDKIFQGMVLSLEALRKIHEAKGDPTAKEIKLEKRILQTV